MTVTGLDLAVTAVGMMSNLLENRTLVSTRALHFWVTSGFAANSNCDLLTSYYAQEARTRKS